MNTVALPIDRTQTEEEQAQFNAGFTHFYARGRRAQLSTDAERRGFDEARGELAYHRAMLAQQAEVDEAQGEYSDWRWA